MNKFEVLLQKILRYLEGNKPFKIVVLGSGELDFIPDKKMQGKENCRILFEYLLRHKEELFSKQLSLKEFDGVRTLMDNCYLYRKMVDKHGEFENLVLSLRLGGNIPASWLKEHLFFKKFIKNNHLHHRLFALRLALPFDLNKGPAIPLQEGNEIKWVYWSEIEVKDYQFYVGEKLLFKTDYEYCLLPGYTCLHLGICKYDVGTDPKWEPFQIADPKEWGNKYVLEVWTVSLPMSKPPMFQRTHAYAVLKDNKGNVRSVGQDVLVDKSNYRITELLNRKPGFGKITTPDIYTFYPINSRRFWSISLEITKEEHDRIVQIVEKDKANKEHSMSVMKGNCVSYVLKILKEGIGIELDASMHALHIMAKAVIPNSWYKAFFSLFDPWYEQRSEFQKKLIYFLPIIYIPSFFVGIAALFTRQNNYQEVRDFSFLDLIIRPWKLSCEHPLALHRKLDAIQDIIPTLRSLYKS